MSLFFAQKNGLINIVLFIKDETSWKELDLWCRITTYKVQNCENKTAH